MTTFLLFFFPILLGFSGLYLFLCDLCGAPDVRARKVLASLKKTKAGRPCGTPLQKASEYLAGKLSRLFDPASTRSRELQLALTQAGISEDVCLWRARGWLIPLISFLPAAILFPFVPVLSVLVLSAAFILSWHRLRSLRKKTEAFREDIESCLADFVLALRRRMDYDRDLEGFLQDYIAGGRPSKAFSRELSVTLADMRSGNPESALGRLALRVGSPALSDTVRGLQALLRGDDCSFYLDTLASRLADRDEDRMRRAAAKIPKRVRRLSVALLLCFMAQYLAVIAGVLLTSLGGMFA